MPPVNELEKKLVKTWSEVLGINENVIGIDDNFFEIGGHSLRATILTARIHKVFNLKVQLKEIFRCQTIRELAKYMTEDLQEDKYGSIEAVEKKEHYPQSSAQKRMFSLDQLENIGTSYNVTAVLKIKGKFDMTRCNRAIADLVRRHESLRTSFRLRENEAVQQVHHMVEFEIKEICGGRGEFKETDMQELMKEFIRPFDLSQVPLWRVGLVHSLEEEYLLVYDIHHIVADGSSKGLILNDFIRLYEGEVLEPLRIQYKDFTVWQDKLLKSGKIKQQEDFWLDLYSDGIPILDFPTDYPRPGSFAFEGDVFEYTIKGDYISRFKELGLDYGATLYMNLSAALYVLLYKYTGQEDFIIGSGVAGRPNADLQDIIGFFVNLLPIRNFPTGEKRYDEFLLEVKDSCLKAFENQDLQFDQLVEKLDLERDPARNPLFDIIFSSQNFEKRVDDQESRKEVNFLPYRFKNKSCKIDMELAAVELDDAVHFNLEYSTRLFKKSTVETFFRRYDEIIKQVVENKKIELKDINLSHSLISIKTDIYESSQRDFNF
jgi:acyl carrier protein/3-phenylpropionate/cinnamic acid dioxygenase small subunit